MNFTLTRKHIEEIASYQSWITENPERKKHWGPLTEGIENDVHRRKLEVLLDNNEMKVKGMDIGSKLTEAHDLTKAGLTTSDDLKAHLGMQRAIFPRLISDKLVSIQPLSKATGQLFQVTWKDENGRELQTADNDYADNATELLTVKDVYFDLTKIEVEVKAKKLKAHMSIEVMQDLLTEHGLDAKSEVMDEFSWEIASEINGEVITDMFTQAYTEVAWSSTPPAGDVTTEEKRKYKQTLGDALIDGNNAVFDYVRQDCEYIVGGTAAVAYLQKMQDHGFTQSNSDEGMAGIKSIGTFNGTYKVYKSNYAPANQLLMGFKGRSWLNAAYVYAPYIIGWMTPPIWDNTFGYTRGTMSRFGKQAMRSGKGLAVITISSS